MKTNRNSIEQYYAGLTSQVKEMVDKAVKSIVDAKKQGGKVRSPLLRVAGSNNKMCQHNHIITSSFLQIQLSL